MVIITTKKTRPRAENDCYETPQELADLMVERLVPPASARFLDPGCGAGVFGRAIRKFAPTARIDGIDVARQILSDNDPYDNVLADDFMSHHFHWQYNIIIGNPPYNHAEEFVRQGWNLLAERGRMVFLLKLAFLESKGRAAGLFRELPPNEVHVLDRRPSFYNNGKTNDYAFAIFVWDVFRYDMTTQLKWFQW